MQNRIIFGVVLLAVLMAGGLMAVEKSESSRPALASDGTRTFVPPPGGVISHTLYIPYVAYQPPTDGLANYAVYLPYLAYQPPPPSPPPDINPARAPRMGFGSKHQPLEFPTVRDLNAGWYVNWNINARPQTPGGMEFVQMVRLHQKTKCGSRVSPDRVACPYVYPHDYEYNDIDRDYINRIAGNNPGSTYLVGNECDRRDWWGGGQDEILPELYVLAYHEIYNWVKIADPTAKVAICGLIQPTPLRLEYLDRVLAAYKDRYDMEMPVDIWNIHLFAIQELKGDWGADIPVGIEYTDRGSFVNQGNAHIDLGVFARQLFEFRQFMAKHGQQDKPLYITEYGVLYDWDAFTEERVHEFMLGTFEHMTNARDCELSTSDDCRLAQRWAWFSLADIDWGFNVYTTLYDVDTKNMLPAGEKYRQFTLDNFDALQYNP